MLGVLPVREVRLRRGGALLDSLPLPAEGGGATQGEGGSEGMIQALAILWLKGLLAGVIVVGCLYAMLCELAGRAVFFDDCDKMEPE